MEYRCLLWDFDGTLADTGSDVWNSLTYAARRAGGAIDDLYCAMTPIWPIRWMRSCGT